MRTTRVDVTTSSVFRNEQQYLHAGDISHNFAQHLKRQFKKNKMHDQGEKEVDLKQNKQQQIVDNLIQVYFGISDDLKMRRDINETAEKISRINNQQKRLNSYISSI